MDTAIGSGEIELTDGGRISPNHRLRLIGQDAAERDNLPHKPPAKKAQFEDRTLKMVPREIKQCFDEAGPQPELTRLSWRWDILANAARGYHDEEMLAVGEGSTSRTTSVTGLEKSRSTSLSTLLYLV